MKISDRSLDNAIETYKTVVAAFEKSKNTDDCRLLDKVTIALLEELKEYRALGTVEELRDLKKKIKEIKYDLE